MKKLTLCLLVLIFLLLSVFAAEGKEAPAAEKKVVIMGKA